ncbi:MAG: alpha-L-arabinofuranosidase, partial [Bacteroidaceae bacterium]|nr:alpha-L-arabinofuranosidase [Bacteroidaceae bacterium]
AQKKMYYPVLSVENGKVHCEFAVSPKIHQIARTETEDLWLWKPQDYPVLSQEAFAAKMAQLKADSLKAVRVAYSVLDNLEKKMEAHRYRARQERDNMRGDDAKFKDLDSVRYELTVDMTQKKAISPMLFGIFFEDINYAADGGLYAELVQNRDFEYNKNDAGKWTAKTSWSLQGDGTDWSIRTEQPLHANNPHYSHLEVKAPGAQLANEGWDGIALEDGKKYRLSMFLRGKGKVKVRLTNKEGATLAMTTFSANPKWTQQKTVLKVSGSAADGRLVVEPVEAGQYDLDMVSLFPVDTYKGRENGLRRDLAEKLADLRPQFVRFPGGCMSHGNGIDNIYHWQATVGELWERQPDFNIWHYHQTRGLGFYEYFQFCEDIGAEPLPVLSAGVPCQNSSRGGHGQQGGIPWEAGRYTYNGKPLTMASYLQELLDLIEWANGDAATSKLAALRAKAGHPKPFNLKYLGIGNEDLLGDVFNERFDYLNEGVKKAHPEITVVGTVGPFWEGSDYEYGWQHAAEKNLSIVDEHYYNPVGWYLHNQDFYDKYKREGTKVYLGEWASKGNLLENALAEALHINGLERNGDVVCMSSYAPLLAKEGHTQWNPDMIYFNNTEVKPTPNYYVQMMAGQNAGDEYVYAESKFTAKGRETADAALRVSHSVTLDKETGDLIIKLVNALPQSTVMPLTINGGGAWTRAIVTTLTGHSATAREVEAPVTEEMGSVPASVVLPPYSYRVLRLKR